MKGGEGGVDEVEAVVINIKPKIDNRGKRAIAMLSEGVVTDPPIDGSVMFFLNKAVWKSPVRVCERMKVILQGVYETVDGWQAGKARPKQLQIVSGPKEQKHAVSRRKGKI